MRIPNLCRPTQSVQHELLETRLQDATKVAYVSNAAQGKNDLDTKEYLDYVVPSEWLRAFFDLTLVAVLQHQFCDL